MSVTFVRAPLILFGTPLAQYSCPHAVYALWPDKRLAELTESSAISATADTCPLTVIETLRSFSEVCSNRLTEREFMILAEAASISFVVPPTTRLSFALVRLFPEEDSPPPVKEVSRSPLCAPSSKSALRLVTATEDETVKGDMLAAVNFGWAEKVFTPLIS